MLIDVSEEEYENIAYDRMISEGFVVMCEQNPEFMKSCNNMIKEYMDVYKK
jgi:hypothetical protein